MSRPAQAAQPAQLSLADRVGSLVVTVPDFPQPGVAFQDLTPVFGDYAVFSEVVKWFAGLTDLDAVAGVESRGFLLGAPVALAVGVPLIAVRKAGKLPRAVLEESYDLEYGSATLAVHVDAFPPGARVLVVDDVLATGGTAAAAAALVERAGASVAGIAVLLEIDVLGGRARLAPLPVHSLLSR